MNKKVLIVVDIILFIITVIAYKVIFDFQTERNMYIEETTKFIEDSQDPVFKINKIVLWSSAYAVDNSDKQLKDIDISQYTDIEIYIDNKSKNEEITAENTVNELFINNIKIDTNELNRDIRFNYKNPHNFGKFEDIANYQDDEVSFKVIHSNLKQSEFNFDEANFFTDCSNPITLGYVNKNFLTHCEISGESGLINFDGSILSKTTQNLKSLNSKITFDIHLVNNYNETFLCNASVYIDLSANNNAIDSGLLRTEIIPEDNELIFIKQYK